MSKAFNEFHDEILNAVIKPKFQILAGQRNFHSKKDFFGQFREEWKCTVSDTILKKWMKDLGYELVECTEMKMKGNPTTVGNQTPELLNEADGFDNETKFDFSIGGIVNESGIGSR